MGGSDRTGTRSPAVGTSIPVPREPVRTCIGCRGTDSWSALLRVVAESAAVPGPVPVVVTPDPRHRSGGRGAWLHPTVACCELALRRRAFARALRVSAPVDAGAVMAFVTAHSQADVRPMGTESGFDADERPMSTQQ
ncbi:MAG: YlxR family protein [Actinobacteria bacterium]|nr:YlxR family protein [Actinomycetota bacterium]